MTRLDKAKEALDTQNATCAVTKGEALFLSREHGVKPLLVWLDTPDFFAGASVADRVIGKAAALLLVYGGIGELHARVISEHAAQVLEENKIPYTFDRKVPYIINRTQTGMCPMENRVLAISDPGEAYEALKAAVAALASR